MTELEKRTQQVYDGLHNFVTRGIPEEYMDIVEKNLRKFCVNIVEHNVERKAENAIYITDINFYNKEYALLDVESRLVIFGKDEHWNNVLNTLWLVSSIYKNNKKKLFFNQKRLSYQKCKECFCYVLREADACPQYLKNHILVEAQLIWEYLWRIASISGWLYCRYIWLKFPKGKYRLPTEMLPDYEKKLKKDVVY